MPANWFAAIQGKRQGPLTNEQLKHLADSGQLQPTDMIMQEGAGKWAPASAVRGLFATSSIQTQPNAPAPPAAGSGQWFYAQNKQRFGPVTFAQLKDMAFMGQLQPGDMVNQAGSPGWMPASQVAGLYDDDGTSDKVKKPSGGMGAIGKVGGAALSVFGATRNIAVAASQEAARRARMAGLRKDIDRQQEELDKKLPREIGAQLLNNNVRVPGCEQLLKTFARLNKDFSIANQGAITGDKDKKKEAAKIAGELEPIMMSYGQAALDSPVAFENRDECLQRRNKLVQEIGQKKGQLAALEKEWQGASKGKKRGVMAAFVLIAAVLLVGIGLGLWFLKDSLFSGTSVASTGTGASNAAAPTEPDRQLSLKELFAKLAPSVPQIESVGISTGSGFLIEDNGNLLVITNRHVVEDASNGVAVHFLRNNGAGAEEKLTCTPDECKIVAIHREADLAVINVDKASHKIRGQWKIPPVKLATKTDMPQVGEHVFAIGHPGGGEQVLTRTLSDGIVSAIGRKMEHTPGTYTQVTVPINPGNSGGPLFDDHGRVVAINTFIIRGGGGRVTLEGLNFCLEISSLHELMADKSKSMDSGQIAAVLGTIGPSSSDNPLAAKAKAMAEEWQRRGFHYISGSPEKGQRLMRLRGGANRPMQFTLTAGKQYTIGVVSQGADDIDLLVVDIAGGNRILAFDTDSDPSPIVSFKPSRTGAYGIVVINPTSKEALVHMSIFEK